MPQYCCVPQCKNNKGGYKFPSNPSLKKKWVVAVKRKGPGNKPWQPSQHDVVCKDHFTSSDFYPASNQRKRLFSSAVPSIFAFKETKIPRKMPNRNKIYKQCSDTLVCDNLHNESRMADVESSEPLNEEPIIEDLEIPIYSELVINNDTEYYKSADEIMLDNETTEELPSSSVKYEPAGTTAMFDITNFKNNNDAINYYTGFKDYKHFLFVFNILGPAVNELNYKSHLGAKNEFFIVMLKLRQAKDDRDLSFLFGVSETTINRIVNTWINFLYFQLSEIDIWPTKATVQSYMPSDFKKKFPNTRVILDATEVPIEKPSDVLLQSASFSKYKNHNTLKTMIGISPRGTVTFISDSYGGSTSDRQIIERSDLVSDPHKFDKGDCIIADRGINVQDIFAPKDVHVNIPNLSERKTSTST